MLGSIGHFATWKATARVKMAYNLRKRTSKNYRKLVSVSLPRADLRVTQKHGLLYPIKVIEEAEGRVKIHYMGYDDKHDEWRPNDEIVDRE